ncbi:MAG: hypothetical protein ACI4DN_09870 [Lachnospiraceae bacterium]
MTVDIPLDENDYPEENNSAWNEYARFHDRFVEQLSYSTKEGFCKTNVWDYAYV